MIEPKKKNPKNTFSLSFIFTPILMVIFPILSFYQKNISELSLKFLVEPLFYSISLGITMTFIILALTKNKNKSALISSLFIFIFFTYGHISNSLNNIVFIQLPNKVVLGPDKILLPIITVLFILINIKILKTARKLEQVIIFLNVSLFVLTGALGITIARTEYYKKSASEIKSTLPQNQIINRQLELPDIYYIILDGYARQDILNEIYNYDNSWFIDGLEKMGFYVAGSARSNYMHTFLSLPSTLNMKYLDELPQKFGVNPVNELAARQLISENKVTQMLKSQKYTIINFASTWEETNESFKADIIYKGDEYYKILNKNITINEANIIFLKTTLLSPLINKVWGDIYRERIQFTLQKLPTIPYMQGNKFVMAHIIAPHPPYVFTVNGDPIQKTEFTFSDEGPEQRDKYLGQLIFISHQILKILKEIITNSTTPPIIILQSDHGPASIFGRPEDWLKNYSEEGLKERSGILYAIYFPDRNYQQLYNSITPVNTFRIIFNKYFGENLELLPDKTFYTSYEKIYKFKDVTNVK